MLPARFRAALAFRERQPVVLRLEGDSVRVATAEAAPDAAIAAAQVTARTHGGRKGGAVDAFIAERRAEAAEE